MAEKDKCDKKVKKCDRKTGKKCDRKTGKKCGALIAFLAFAAMFCGCAQTGSQPARSQTMNNDFSRCIVIIAARASVSNETVSAEGGDGSANECFTQTQKNEGNESNSPTASPTVDIKPQTTLNYGLTSSTPSGAKWIDALDGGCAKLLSSWLGSGKANGTMEVTKTDGTKETVTCKDGVCTTADGDCITCPAGGCPDCRY